MAELINTQVKVCDFTTISKKWNLSTYNKILHNIVIEKIYMIHIPINHIIDDKIVNFTSDGAFSVKTASQVNNNLVRPYPESKFVSSI